jgi:hypothetical protein
VGGYNRLRKYVGRKLRLEETGPIPPFNIVELEKLIPNYVQVTSAHEHLCLLLLDLVGVVRFDAPKALAPVERQ